MTYDELVILTDNICRSMRRLGLLHSWDVVFFRSDLRTYYTHYTDLVRDEEI